MRNIIVKASEVKKAVKKASENNFQAHICEILLMPKLAKRYQELNPRHKNLRVEKHEGQFYPEGYAKTHKVEDWSIFAGYTLKADCWTWNSVGEGTDRGYSHGAGRCYDGIRRETVYHFAYMLSAINSCIEQGRAIPQSFVEELLVDYKITFVNDLA